VVFEQEIATVRCGDAPSRFAGMYGAAQHYDPLAGHASVISENFTSRTQRHCQRRRLQPCVETGLTKSKAPTCATAFATSEQRVARHYPFNTVHGAAPSGRGDCESAPAPC
jgi:hypothetical protein